MDSIAMAQGGGEIARFSAAPPGDPGVPESRDVEEFNRIYHAGAGGTDAATAAGEGEAPSLGGSLLEGIESFGRTHEQKVDALQKALDRFSSGDLSVQDMLDVQLKLADLSLTETYALKLGEKGTEGFKTLFTNP